MGENKPEGSQKKDNPGELKHPLLEIVERIKAEAIAIVEDPSVFQDIGNFNGDMTCRDTAVWAVNRLYDDELRGDEIADLYEVVNDLEPDEGHLSAKRWLAISKVLYNGGSQEGPTTEADYRDADEILIEREKHAKELDRDFPEIISCTELLDTVFPPIPWLVSGLLGPGLTLFSGPNNAGKTQVALDLSLAVATGERFLERPTGEKQGVLFLALEESREHLQDRMMKMGASYASNLYFVSKWPQEVISRSILDEFLYVYPSCKMIVIDTLARFRSHRDGTNQYNEDFKALVHLREIANANGCSIIVIQHSRKVTAKDPLDLVGGLNEAVDATWILTRDRGLAGNSLFVSAIDREEQTINSAFDWNQWRWSLIKDAAERALGKERREILDLLLPGVELQTGDIVKALGKKPPAVSYLLKMVEATGLIYSPGIGKWARTPESLNP